MHRNKDLLYIFKQRNKRGGEFTQGLLEVKEQTRENTGNIVYFTGLFPEHNNNTKHNHHHYQLKS